MSWAQPFRASEANRTRSDLARELDAALHPDGPPITGPVTEAAWSSLLTEVKLQGAVASSRAAEDEAEAGQRRLVVSIMVNGRELGRHIEGGPPDARR